MTVNFTVILSLAFGAFGWIVLEFVGRPIRTFFDLRKEASRLIAKYSYDTMSGPLSVDAREDYRKIGAQLVAFDESEPFAAPIVRRMGFEPELAGKAMLVVASKWGDTLQGKAVARALEGVRHALKLPISLP